MTTVDVGRPRNGNAFCGRYARPASRFPARPGALPCSLHRIPFDRPAMLRMYRGLDGRSTLSRCRVQEPSAAEGSQCDAVALAGSPCHQWLCGHKQGWPGPSFDHMSGLRHRDIPFSRLSLLESLILIHSLLTTYTLHYRRTNLTIPCYNNDNNTSI